MLLHSLLVALSCVSFSLASTHDPSSRQRPNYHTSRHHPVGEIPSVFLDRANADDALLSASIDISIGASVSVTVSSATSTSAATTPTASTYTGPKFASIHFMVGNTYTYRLVDWMTDILDIEEAGFDAIALNLGSDCWQQNSVELAYQAVNKLRSPVKLFLSLDMSVWSQADSDDAQTLATLINKYATNPAQFLYNGLPFVSTFSGDQYGSSFGLGLCDGWNELRSYVPTNMYFVPGFFFPESTGITIANVSQCVEGLFQWNSAWSIDGTPVSSQTDLAWIEALGPNKTYMAGISPTFFTHYGADSLNKNFVYGSENNYATRWQQVTNISAPLVQVITWNDFGESHYIGHRPETTQNQPFESTWVNSHNHLPWLRITKPHIQVYKNGAPDSLASDTIVWEYRVHPANATATDDVLDRPTGTEWLTDNVYITAYLANPAEVRITAGTLEGSFNGSAGLNYFVQPFTAGAVAVSMWRDGVNVGGTVTNEVNITDTPAFYNYNPIVEQFFHDPVWQSC